MTHSDLKVFVYDWLLTRGTPPRLWDIAQHFATTREKAAHELATLKIGKAMLQDPATGEIWMAGPFASAPTTYAETDGTIQWWANCAWDMFGIAVVAARPVQITAQCTDCGEQMNMRAFPDRAPEGDDGIVHFLLPAARWYDDIGFT